jgi:hypothetical protein
MLYAPNQFNLPIDHQNGGYRGGGQAHQAVELPDVLLRDGEAQALHVFAAVVRFNVGDGVEVPCGAPPLCKVCHSVVVVFFQPKVKVNAT